MLRFAKSACSQMVVLGARDKEGIEESNAVQNWFVV